jgi:methylenetetrahydrofolate reductase (NADPH)
LRTFREAIQGDRFTLTAELTLARDSTADDVRRQADVLGRYVDAIQVTDNPYAWVQMSAVSAAAILRGYGIDPVPILTCRDRNRIALESDLLGLRALGVSSVILTRGQRVPQKHAVQAGGVFDLSGRELIALAASFGGEESATRGPEFLVGTSARVFRPGPEWQAESLAVRAAAGARFLQTQLCFNVKVLQQYMQALVAAKLTWRYSVIVSLAVLPSAITAHWVKKNLAGSRIPKSVIRRLEQAPDPQREGICICAEKMQEIAAIPGISGINLMTTGDAAAITAAIEASGLRSGA